MVAKSRSIFLIAFLCVCVASFAGKANPPKKYPDFTRADSLHGYLSPIRGCYDVQFYDIRLDIDPEKERLQGFVSMDFVFVDTTQSEIQIDLSSLLQIDSITIDGESCAFSREYNAVYVAVHQRKLLEKTYTLTCWYQGVPAKAVRPPWEGGMVWKQSASGKPWFGVTCETLGASCLIPCKDHLSDEPDKGMRMAITVPKDLVIVSNGLLQSHETIGEKERWVWQTNYPINSYNITFYGGDFVHFGEMYDGVESSFPLDYYVLPEDLEKAKVSFEQAKTVLAAYEEFFGPYPWAKECFKLVESPYEGMEHQTAIAYGNGFKNTFGFDYIIVHEVAHEWWGNTVSVDDYAEIFIHEGFAMYAEFLYVEKLFGVAKRNRYIRVWADAMKNIRPVVGPRDVNFWDYHDTDPYIKGAWTLHGLRYVIADDSLFFDIIKTYNISRRNSIVTVKDFTDYVNEKTGQDYSWYFRQYLYSAEKPVLQYCVLSEKKGNSKGERSGKVSDGGNDSRMLLKWTNVDSTFKLPVSFLQFDENGNSIPVGRIEVDSKGTTAELPHGLYFNLFNAYFDVRQVKRIK